MTVSSIQELEISSIIATELRPSAGALQQSVYGRDVASAIKTIAALDFGVSVAQLPEPIVSLYDEALEHPARVYALDEAIRRLKE